MSGEKLFPLATTASSVSSIQLTAQELSVILVVAVVPGVSRYFRYDVEAASYPRRAAQHHPRLRRGNRIPTGRETIRCRSRVVGETVVPAPTAAPRRHRRTLLSGIV